jgi:hypothetical protein
VLPLYNLTKAIYINPGNILSMAWFNKKKGVSEEIPQLPTLPEDQDFSLPPPEASDLPTDQPQGFYQPGSPEQPDLSPPQGPLPPLPDEKEGYGKEIKQEIESPLQYPSEQGLIPPPQQPPAPSYPQQRPQAVGMRRPRRTLEVEDHDKYEKTFVKSTPGGAPPRRAGPVFVRLDKFETTIQAFNEMKSKISQIENLLTKIKEVRDREDRELEEWEREIQAMKARIDSIDKNIFENIG